MTHRNRHVFTLGPLGLFLMASGFALLGLGQPAFSQTAHSGTQIHITLIDFRIHPERTTAKAGWVNFQAVNVGKTMHELVILRTDLHPDNLPRIAATNQTGTVTGHIVNEEHAAVDPIDEIEEFAAGTRQEKKVFLDPGRYVLFW